MPGWSCTIGSTVWLFHSPHQPKLSLQLTLVLKIVYILASKQSLDQLSYQCLMLLPSLHGLQSTSIASYQELEVSGWGRNVGFLENPAFMGAVGKPSGLDSMCGKSALFLSRKKMGKLEALPLNLGPNSISQLVSGECWLYPVPGGSHWEMDSLQGDQLGSEGSLKEPWKVFHYFCGLSNCSLKGTRCLLGFRNLSHHSKTGAHLVRGSNVSAPPCAEEACLSTEEGARGSSGSVSLSHRKTYLVSRRLEEWLHHVEESERGSCLIGHRELPFREPFRSTHI